jgi:hypothetical protein
MTRVISGTHARKDRFVEPRRRIRDAGRNPDDRRTHVSQAVATHDEHCIEVQRTALPGYANQVVGLFGICTCGWRSETHQVYLGASTDWAEQRAKHSIERAHLRSLLA